MHRHLRPQDWDTLAADPEFTTLLHARRRFTLPATIFFLAYYLALPLLLGIAPVLMNRPLVGPLTVACAFALSQFVVTWALVVLYMHRAKRFDAMAARVVERAREQLVSTEAETPRP